jgi:hypothetical protein
MIASSGPILSQSLEVKDVHHTIDHLIESPIHVPTSNRDRLCKTIIVHLFRQGYQSLTPCPIRIVERPVSQTTDRHIPEEVHLPAFVIERCELTLDQSLNPMIRKTNPIEHMRLLWQRTYVPSCERIGLPRMGP